MASLRYEDDRGRGGWRLQFRDAEKKKRSIWLGGVEEDKPKKTKAHVEHLLVVQKLKLPPEAATVVWLSEIDYQLREKLANCGLVESASHRQGRNLRVEEWIDMYIEERKDVKPGTISTYEKAKDNLVTFFGIPSAAHPTFLE